MLRQQKLDRLRERARVIASRRARAIRATLCVGLDLEQILLLVAKAVGVEDRPIFEAIIEQGKDYAARTPQESDGYPDLHGFVDWLIQLRHGITSLPDELPKSWLIAWRDGYVREFGWSKRPWSPHPFHRCEDCRLALPNVGPDGSFDGRRFQSCPACGGRRISWICFHDMRKFRLDGEKTDRI